jgi:alkanesulfonate monooxygenase SsuD/methylene tetrahydromethanopterin reductase-like flavin-dependent oxidoreductase (luciferase family)
MAAPKIEFGLYLPQLGFSWQQVVERVQAADELGYHSAWFLDHFYPPYLPKVDSFEAWTTVSALAPQTRRIRLGHLVICNAFRHPALLAKMAASLDVISGGRLELELGTGSVLREFGEFGIPLPSFAERTAMLEEAVQVIKSMFTQDMTHFEGKYYQLRDAPLAPKSVQKPWPPITIGGTGEKYTMPLAARHADIWNSPTYGAPVLAQKIAALRAECGKIGRDPATLKLSEQAILVIVKDKAELDAAMPTARRHYGGEGYALDAAGYIGTPDAIIKRIRERAALGVTLFTFFFHDRAQLKTLELFAKEVIPAFA